MSSIIKKKMCDNRFVINFSQYRFTILQAITMYQFMNKPKIDKTLLYISKWVRNFLIERFLINLINLGSFLRIFIFWKKILCSCIYRPIIMYARIIQREKNA